MEWLINSVTDDLVLPLQYQLPKTARYIVDCRDVSFFASGSDVYIPVGGDRVSRVNLNCENWLVPHSLRRMFTLNKKSGGAVKVIGNPYKSKLVWIQAHQREPLKYVMIGHVHFCIFYCQ